MAKFEDTATSEEITSNDVGFAGFPDLDKDFPGDVNPALLSLDPITIEGEDEDGPVQMELVVEAKKYLVGYFLAFGIRTGERVTIAVKTDSRWWTYTKEMKKELRYLSGKNLSKRWQARVHTCYR
jgi:hypothetical protein